MQYFGLFNSEFPVANQLKTPIKKNNIEQLGTPLKGKQRRQPRRSQIVLSSTIPFSSPAGQQLIKLSKSSLANGYIQEKLERSDRYCCAPPLNEDTLANWPKPIKYNRIPVTFRRPQDQAYRWYKFPRRQNYQSWHREAFLNLNINELKLCKPVMVKLKRLTENDIEAFHLENSLKNSIKMGDVDTSEPPEQSNSDVIDLCLSSDDESSFTCGDDDTEILDFDDIENHDLHDIDNVSESATTPRSTSSVNSMDPMETSFEIYNETSSTMFNLDENYQCQNLENHQNFLNGAQGSILEQIDKLSGLSDISVQAISSTSQAHISIDLTL